MGFDNHMILEAVSARHRHEPIGGPVINQASRHYARTLERQGRSARAGESDCVAEGFDLADVFASFAGCDAAGVITGSEVVEADGELFQQVPDDDQDAAGDGNQGFELAAAARDPSVLLAEEGVGAGGCGGGFAEEAIQ
jgi:hypothetical protein